MTKLQRMVVMDKCFLVAKLQQRERGPLKMIATLHKKFVDASTTPFNERWGRICVRVLLFGFPNAVGARSTSRERSKTPPMPMCDLYTELR